MGTHERTCFGLAECELLQSHFAEFPTRAQGRQGQRRITPRCNDQMQVPRRVFENGVEEIVDL